MDYKNKFGMTNLLTDEEKSKYSTFANKVHTMGNSDLFKLYTNSADELTTEMQDIVSFEVRIREWEALKRKNIDPKVAFSVEATQENAIKKGQQDYFNSIGDPILAKLAENDKTTIKYRAAERQKLEGMSLDALEKAKQIIEAHPQVVKQSMLHDKNGGGVNMMAKKYIVEDNNGEQILINNEKVQEHFRKMYIKRLSEVTGIDYTQYNEALGVDTYSSSNELISSVSGNSDFGWGPTPNNTQNDINIDKEIAPQINLDEYEDD